MNLIGAGEVFIGRRDHRPVGILQPVQPRLKPFHRDAAQIDDIGAHRAFVRRDQRAHQVAVFKDNFGFRDQPVPEVCRDARRICHACLFLCGVCRDPNSAGPGRLAFFRRCGDGPGQALQEGLPQPPPGPALALSGQTIFWPVLAQSFRNWSRPLSVRTWFAIALMTAGGAVMTSAPILAQSITWFTVRIEAARISVR